VPAISNAAAIAAGMSSARLTRNECFVIGIVMPDDVGLLERVGAHEVREDLPVMQTIGTESM
jgi:hypothetical protein